MKNKLASYSTFLYTLLYAPFLYFIGPIIVLRSPTSLSSKICEVDDKHCMDKPYSLTNCFLFDVCCWSIGYQIGLHFTFFKYMRLKGFNLVPHQMKEWPAKNWIFFCCCAVFVIGVVATLIYHYVMSKVALYYLCAILLIIALILIPAILLRKTMYVHVHHYNFGMLWVVLIGYQSYFFAVIAGVANGMMIEGGAVYAYDPVFKKKKVEDI